VIVNVADASGTIGTQRAARATADSHTLLFAVRCWPWHDWEQALTLVNGDEGMLQMVLAMFVEDVPNNMAALHAAMAASDAACRGEIHRPVVDAFSATTDMLLIQLQQRLVRGPMSRACFGSKTEAPSPYSQPPTSATRRLKLRNTSSLAQPREV
jgi:HPt (histidine-containing phosphotransfer) domain-containing protein